MINFTKYCTIKQEYQPDRHEYSHTTLAKQAHLSNSLGHLHLYIHFCRS